MRTLNLRSVLRSSQKKLPTRKVYDSFKVDGGDLGCTTDTWVTDTYNKRCLIAQEWNGKETKKALRLQKASVVDCAAGIDGKPWRAASKSASAKTLTVTEPLRTTVRGSEEVVRLELSLVNTPKRRQISRNSGGGLLGTIKLYYCIAVGLIFAGVLPRPPFWFFTA